jgi:hypothetical protein
MSLVNFRTASIASEEPDTKIEKKLAKIKIKLLQTFLTFLGSAVLGGAVALFFKKKSHSRSGPGGQRQLPPYHQSL